MSAKGALQNAAPSKRILLIEDDCDHADALMALLELEGYAIECAPDGARGLERLQEAPPDLILRRYFSGFDAYLAKPIDSGQMLTLVAELIGEP